MKIGIDFDDVLAHSHLLKPMVARALFGLNIQPDSFQKDLILSRGLLTEEQYRIVGKEVFSGKYPITPVPDALVYIPVLIREGHLVRVITSRSSDQENLKPAKDWLKQHGLDLSVTGVGYGSSKAKACQGLDMFVDDDLEKLESVVGVVPHLLLFSWPHKTFAVPKGVTQVRSWVEVYQYVNRVV